MKPAARETSWRSCTLCEAHCGIEVEVDAAAGRVLAIRGDAEDENSRGFLCPKAIGLKALQEDPDRLRRPLRRRGNDFEEIGWEDALELAAGRLREIREAHGADALATYLGNPNAHDFGALLAMPTFQRALGTRWRFSATSVDQLPKTVSSCLLFGRPGAFPIPDLERTDFLLVLGANPVVSNGSLLTAPDMPGRLRRLRERGGRLVVVDPRRSETAALADWHLPILPGGDAFLLMAMVHVLFAEARVQLGRLAGFANGVEALRELAEPFAPEAVEGATGLPAESIRRLARELAAAPRAAVYGRIGTCTQEFGTLASWLVDVLNALTGNLDREGGAMFPWPAHAPADAGAGRRGRIPYARWHSRVRGLPEFGGELPVAALAEEIEPPDPRRVRALVTVAGNPVLSTPNAARLERALASLEFMVSVDLYVNETTRHAQLILPTTTPLERPFYDMAFLAHSVRNHAKLSPAALAPPEGLLHPWQVLLELAARTHGAKRSEIEAQLLAGALAQTTGPGHACDAVDAEEAARRLDADGRRGPLRLLDALLRAGPYGDRYGSAPGGLSVALLEQHPHGVDLGPLAPRLPELLATASGRVELAPELCVADVARLRARLASPARPAGELLLIGRRQLRSNNSWMHNLRPLAKGRPRCTLQLHPEDARARGLADGALARIASRVGALEVPVELSDALRPGVVSLPHGFGHGSLGAHQRIAASLQPGVNSNALADEQQLDALSGNAVLNGIPVRVEAVASTASARA